MRLSWYLTSTHPFSGLGLEQGDFRACYPANHFRDKSGARSALLNSARCFVSMSIEEQSLRDLLASPHAQKCVTSLFGWLRTGEPVIIEMNDGSQLTLVGVEEAREALKLWFGWHEA